MSIKLPSSNDVIALVDDQCGLQLKQIISHSIPFAAHSPEGVDDIYWSFMYKVPQIIADLSPMNIEDYKVIIFAECKFFTKNRCRKWQTKNHQIMNKAYELRDDFPYSDNRNIFELGESQNADLSDWHVDSEHLLSHLTKSDRHTYELYFVKNYSYREIAKIKRWTVHKVITSVERITEIAKKFLSK